MQIQQYSFVLIDPLNPGIIQKYNLAGLHKIETPTRTWTPQAIALLKSLIEQNRYTAKQMAEHLQSTLPECANVSRGSILGKINRLGLCKTSRHSHERSREKQPRTVKTKTSRQKRQPGNAETTIYNENETRPQKRKLAFAAKLLTDYHRQIIACENEIGKTSLTDAELSLIHEFWPDAKPRTDDAEHNTCNYPTAQHPSKKTWIFCSCRAAYRKSYCDAHNQLCTS